MFKNCIVYGDNIIVSLSIKETPFGVKAQFKETLAPGLRRFEIRMGYMEILDFGEILREAGIQEKSIFYGLEDIVSNHLIWRIYAIIQKLTPSFVQFYKLPPDRLHGVVVRAIL
jgi:KUP system potassium uptake protein